MILNKVINRGYQFSIRKWVRLSSPLLTKLQKGHLKPSATIFTLYNIACTYLQVTMHHMPSMTVFYSTQNLCKLFTCFFFWQCTMGQIICKFKEVFIKHTTPAFNSFPYTAFNQESDVLNIFIKMNVIYRYVKAQTKKLCVNNTWPVQLEMPST